MQLLQPLQSTHCSYNVSEEGRTQCTSAQFALSGRYQRKKEYKLWSAFSSHRRNNADDLRNYLSAFMQAKSKLKSK